MNTLISKITENKNWEKWVEFNSMESSGCISVTKSGCISITKNGCISSPARKSGCIS